MKIKTSIEPPAEGVEIFLNNGLANVLLYENVTPIDGYMYEYTMHDLWEPWDGTKEELLEDVIKSKEMWLKKGFLSSKSIVLESLSAASGNAIVSGIDVVTSYGREHFDLKEVDQSNIKDMADVVKMGMPQVPYQSEGGLCRFYTAEEAMEIYIAYLTHKTTHLTYYNQLKAWVQRMETAQELEAVQYGDTLPPDLQQHVEETLEKTRQMLAGVVESLGGGHGQ